MAPIARPYCCPRCEDVSFLLDSGTTPQATASRLGTTPGALKAALNRHGHTTYAVRFEERYGTTEPDKEYA